MLTSNKCCVTVPEGTTFVEVFVVKVATARRRLAARLQEALESGHAQSVCRVTGYVRAMGVALAPYSGDDEVDVAHLTVDSEQAAHILGYHREHVRRLVRQETLPAEKEGNEYRIPLTSVIVALEGGISSWVAPGVLRRLRALMTVWLSPEAAPPK
jgi:excisionase family DNA binding protein